VKADKAAIESANAQLNVQQAAVEAARVQLGYTVMRSPIDGRTGDLTVKPGNLVSANNTQLMTIAQVEPIFVTFSVPAVHLSTIKHAASAGRSLKVIW
jgi:multidrug efflux system membrane fusion protein